MKYFKLFEQFINEELSPVNESLEDDKKLLDELYIKIEDAKAKMDAISDEYEKRKDYSFRDDPEYAKAEDEYSKLRGEHRELDRKIYDEEQAQKKKENGEQGEKEKEKSSPEPEEKSDTKLDDKQEAILSKIEAAEDVISDTFNYEFRKSPSNQIRIIVAGGDKAKESIKKYKEDIANAQDSLQGSKEALEDAKIDGDKQEVKIQTARIELRKAEIELFNAIIAGNPEGVAGPIKKIAKFAKALDNLEEY
jgi:chromosome segregation ATPase